MSNELRTVRKDHADFVQLTRGYMRDMRELVARSPAAFRIFLLMAERMNKTNALMISQATIGEILNLSRTTVSNALKILEKERWLQVVKVGQQSAYVLNSKVLWRDKSGKRYSSFYAEVFASESEQNHKVEDWDTVELRQVPLLKNGERVIVGNDILPPPDQQDLDLQ